jgi:hypothetical protein
MKCILHIGTEKTGTTAIQEWMHVNRSIFLHQGVFISEFLGVPDHRIFSAFFQNEFDDWTRRNNLRTSEDKAFFFRGFLDGLRAEIQKARQSANTFLISSEHLHSRLRTSEEIFEVQKFLASEFDSVDIVCYFRDQYDTARSLYSTHLRVDGTLSFDEFLNGVRPGNYYYNHFEIAENWSSAFGRDSCQFRRYDASDLFQADVRKDFLNIVCPESNFEDFDWSLKRSNESLSFLQAAIFRVINKRIPYWGEGGYTMNLANHIAKKRVLQKESLNKGTIYSDRTHEIRLLFAESNQAFYESYAQSEYASRLLDEKALGGSIPVIDDAVREAFSLGIDLAPYALTLSERQSLTEIRDKVRQSSIFTDGENILISKLLGED